MYNLYSYVIMMMNICLDNSEWLMEGESCRYFLASAHFKSVLITALNAFPGTNILMKTIKRNKNKPGLYS